MLLIIQLTGQELVSQNEIVVHNDQPRMDKEGEIVDAHDGRVIRFGDRYYWYGTQYGKTTGFTPDNTYVCYSSEDLKKWEFEGELLPDAPEGVYYRPHVVYHEGSQRYILWYNWYPKLWDGQFGVAISASPEGPFEIFNDNVRVAHSQIGVGDFGLFIDRDQTAYLCYNTIQDHQVSIERLSSDYLSSTMENGGFIAKYCEAGSMFRRNDLYYLLTDYTCCFCGHGSGARVYISESPLDGYELTGNINRYPGVPLPQLTDNNVDKFNTYREDSLASLLCELGTQTTDSVELILNWPNPYSHCDASLADDPWEGPFYPEVSIHFEGVDEIKPSSVSNKVRNVTYAFKPGMPLSGNCIIKALASEQVPLQISEVRFFRNGESLDDISIFRATGPKPVIIPAQQTHVMELRTQDGIEYIWMGDLWGSRPDGIKGHDQQYWSSPLEFREDGTIVCLKWDDSWRVVVED